MYTETCPACKKEYSNTNFSVAEDLAVICYNLHAYYAYYTVITGLTGAKVDLDAQASYGLFIDACIWDSN
jgi:hypothetical protein